VLVRLAASGAPLRRAVARLAGRLVAGRARCASWQALGFVRLSDYARERLGLSARELQDLAHVDAALAGLPAVEADFLAGRITWTKVRLLCRAAAPDDEAAWLVRAERTSAAVLARQVRRAERECLEAGGAALARSAGLGETDESGAPEEPCETLRIPCPARVSAKWGAVRQLARRVAGEWLSAADCAEAVTAETISALLPLEAGWEALPAGAADGARGRADDGGGPSQDPSSAEARAARAHPAQVPEPSPFVAALVAGLEGAGPLDLDARLRRAVALERGLLARLGPQLLALAAERGFRALGFASLDTYARERLGMAPRKARALLRVERACQRSPALRRAWRSGALSWSQAQTLVAVALAEGSGPWLEAWVARAAQVTVRRLEDDVDHALATGSLDPAALPPLPVPLYEEIPAGVQIGALTTAGEGDASGRASWRWRSQVWIHGPVPVIRLLRACLFTAQRRIERQTGRPSNVAEALEALLDHVLESWRSTGPGERRAQREHRVFARDGWRCTVPGCSSYRNLHAHHVRFRSAGGGNGLANLVTLCAAHHLHGVHAGRISIRGLAPASLRFDLPFASFRSGDVVIAS